MRVLIVSDTHNYDDNLMDILKVDKDFDFMVHLGDIGKLEDYVEEVTGLACFAVKGNNDWRSLLPSESIIMLGKHRTFITHGHGFSVYSSSERVREYAMGLGCDIVMYGHTHIPEIKKYNGITVVNPGSLSCPRGGFKRPSYIVATINDDLDVDFEIKFI